MALCHSRAATLSVADSVAAAEHIPVQDKPRVVMGQNEQRATIVYGNPDTNNLFGDLGCRQNVMTDPSHGIGLSCIFMPCFLPPSVFQSQLNYSKCFHPPFASRNSKKPDSWGYLDWGHGLELLFHLLDLLQGS
jgi:hypothetical protein